MGIHPSGSTTGSRRESNPHLVTGAPHSSALVRQRTRAAVTRAVVALRPPDDARQKPIRVGNCKRLLPTDIWRRHGQLEVRQSVVGVVSGECRARCVGSRARSLTTGTRPTPCAALTTHGSKLGLFWAVRRHLGCAVVALRPSAFRAVRHLAPSGNWRFLPLRALCACPTRAMLNETGRIRTCDLPLIRR